MGTSEFGVGWKKSSEIRLVVLVSGGVVVLAAAAAEGAWSAGAWSVVPIAGGKFLGDGGDDFYCDLMFWTVFLGGRTRCRRRTAIVGGRRCCGGSGRHSFRCRIYNGNGGDEAPPGEESKSSIVFVILILFFCTLDGSRSTRTGLEFNEFRPDRFIFHTCFRMTPFTIAGLTVRGPSDLTIE